MIWYMRAYTWSTSILTHTHACMRAGAGESVAQGIMDMHQPFQQRMYMCAFCMCLCYSKKPCDRLCAHLCMHICSKHVLPDLSLCIYSRRVSILGVCENHYEESIYIDSSI